MKLARITNGLFGAALQKLMAEPVTLKVAFKLKGIAARVADELKKYEDVRQAALEKYGSKGEDGKLQLNDNYNVQFTPENLEQFRKELDELYALEVDIPTVKLSDLGDNVKLTAQDVMALDGVLVDE